MYRDRDYNSGNPLFHFFTVLLSEQFESVVSDKHSRLTCFLGKNPEALSKLSGTNTHILRINFFFRWFRFSLWT
jgi:hypothetical protein